MSTAAYQHRVPMRDCTPMGNDCRYDGPLGYDDTDAHASPIDMSEIEDWRKRKYDKGRNSDSDTDDDDDVNTLSREERTYLENHQQPTADDPNDDVEHLIAVTQQANHDSDTMASASVTDAATAGQRSIYMNRNLSTQKPELEKYDHGANVSMASDVLIALKVYHQAVRTDSSNNNMFESVEAFMEDTKRSTNDSIASIAEHTEWIETHVVMVDGEPVMKSNGVILLVQWILDNELKHTSWTIAPITIPAAAPSSSTVAIAN